MKKDNTTKFKILCSVFMLSVSTLSILGQDKLVIKGTKLFVGQENTLFIGGNLEVIENDTKNDDNIYNTGTIIVTDSIKNKVNDLFIHSSNPGLVNGDTVLPMGIVVIRGNKKQWISKDTIFFNDLTIDNDSSLFLSNSIFSFGKISFENGKIYLNGNDINLFSLVDTINLKSGKLGIESYDKNITDSSSVTGYVRAYSDNVSAYTNVGNLGAELYNPYLTYVTVERGHGSLNGVTDTSLSRFYNISSPGFVPVDLGTIVLHYFDKDYKLYSYNEDNIAVFSSDYNDSVYTAYETLTDTVKNTATATNLNLLKRFTLSSRDCLNPPYPHLPSDTVVCQGDSVIIVPNFTKKGVAICKYQWYNLNEKTFVDTASTLVVQSGEINDSASYILTVYDSRGCRADDTISVITQPVPDPHFFPLSDSGPYACQRDSLTLIDSTKGIVISWAWTIGDSDTIFARNPRIHLDSSGVYSVTQLVKNEYGCTGININDITIYPSPVADFESERICYGTSINLINNSLVAGSSNSITQSVWNIDGTTVEYNNQLTALDTVKYNFTEPGNYIISLNIRSYEGNCTDTIEKEITVLPAGNALFDYQLACLGDSTVFHPLTEEFGDIPEFTWDFGDGNLSDEPGPAHKFSTAGSYNVSLSITEGECYYSNFVPVIIEIMPIPDFSNGKLCQQNTTVLQNLTQGSYNFEWIVEGSTLSSINLERPFEGYGNIDVTLRAIHPQQGCITDTTKVVYVNPAPQAEFNSENICFGDTSDFLNISTIVTGEIVSFQWNFSGESGSVEINPQYVFTEGYGIKSVTLQALSDSGCEAQQVKDIEIYKNPAIDLPAELTTCGDSLILMPKETAQQYFWNGVAGNSTYTVHSDGQYIVSLVSEQNCETTDTTHVALNTEFVITTMPGEITDCGFAIIDCGYYPGAYYSWSTGDTTQTTWVNQSGVYQVSVTDQNGCNALAQSNVTVNSYPELELIADSTKCAGDVEIIVAHSNVPGVNWIIIQSGEQFFNVDSIAVIQTATVQATVSSNNCGVTREIHMVFNPLPVLTLPLEINTCNKVVLNPQHEGPVFSWSTGETSPTITVTEPGNYSVQVTDSNSCSAGAAANVVLRYLDLVNLGDDKNLCTYQTDSLDAGEYPTENTIFWDGVQGGRYLNITYEGSYHVRVDALNGCSVYDTIEVFVHEPPVIELADQLAFCSDTFRVEARGEGSYFDWFKDGQLIGQYSILYLTDTGRYVVKAYSDYCYAYDSIDIFETPYRIKADFLVPDSIVVDSTVLFSNVSYNPDGILIDTNKVSYFWVFGDGTYVEGIVHPKHKYFSVEPVNVQLAATSPHCSDTLGKDKYIIEKPIEVKSIDELIPKDLNLIEFVSSKVYPNPASEFVTLEFELSNSSPVLISVFDINGMLIHFERVRVEDFYSKEFYVGKLPQGIYFIQIYTRECAVTHKVIVIK